jgi:Domain of unknown function (DUF1841)
MYNPSRDQARDFLFEAWRKYNAPNPNAPLTSLEAIAVEIIAKHPEYHTQLDRREQFVDRDYAPENGETNPFLHISMHIAIQEQITIDQPRGIREAHSTLSAKLASTMEAEHQIMDCLAEMIWQAQQTKNAPSAENYLSCIEAKLLKFV